MTEVEWNAKCHTSSRLSLKTEPFWNLLLLYFLECMHQVGWKEKDEGDSWNESNALSLCTLPGGCRVYTLLCLQWMVAIQEASSQSLSVHFCLWTGIRQRYSKPGANTKHLNVKSVISIPKSLNIEIRSSVQQRPIFTLIYHGCPCTQGLITPYMVNKPLTCSRQCVMFIQRQCIYCTVRLVNHCLCRKITEGRGSKIRLRYGAIELASIFWSILEGLDAIGRSAWEKLFVCSPFFSPTSVCQSDIHLLEAVLHKQTTPKATTGWLNNHGLFSLFSTIAHCKFLVGPQHAHLCLFNK